MGAYTAITALREHFFFWGCRQDGVLQACTWIGPTISSSLQTFVWQKPYEKKKKIGLYHLPTARAIVGSLEQFWFTVSGQWTARWARQVFAARREAGQTGTWWGRSFSTTVSNAEWSGRNSTLWILSSLSLATSNRFLYHFAHFYSLLAQNRHSS